MNTGVRLWLDDSRAAPEGWVHVHNAEEAKVRLLRGNVDEMSLDCDLDMPECSRCRFACGYRQEGLCPKGCPCHENGRESGLDLVEWMAHRGVWPKTKPVVHSTAGEDAEMMRRIIDHHYPG